MFIKTAVERWAATARVGSLALAAVLSGCATVSYTVDDGRPLDERELADLRTFGKSRQALQEALVRAAAATGRGRYIWAGGRYWEGEYVKDERIEGSAVVLAAGKARGVDE